MNSFKRSLVIIAALAVSFLPCWSTAGAVSSTFDSNLESWTGQGATVTWLSSGNPGGSLKSVDSDGNWAQIIAPSKFHGPWNSAGSVSADIKMANSTSDYHPAFAISDGNTSYEYVFSSWVSTTWGTFSVSLSDPGWTKLTNNGNWDNWSPPLGNETFAQVLQNVQDFRIRTDLVNGTGNIDTTYVDNIRAPVVPLPPPLLLAGVALARLFGRRQR